MDFLHYLYTLEDSNFDLGMSGCDLYIHWGKRVELFANSGDPDQTPYPVTSDVGRHCLPFQEPSDYNRFIIFITL